MKIRENRKHTTIRIPEPHVEILDRLAIEEGLDRSDIIRRAIKEYLAKEGIDNE